MTAEGFIALQVHSINKPEQEGLNVRWKSFLKNQLTVSEKRKGWRLLWDAKSNAGWKGAKTDNFPVSGWEMKDGELSVLESGGGESEKGGCHRASGRDTQSALAGG